MREAARARVDARRAMQVRTGIAIAIANGKTAYWRQSRAGGLPKCFRHAR